MRRSQPLLILVVTLLGLAVLLGKFPGNGHSARANTLIQVTAVKIPTNLGVFTDIPPEALVLWEEPPAVDLIRLTDSSVISVTPNLPTNPEKVDWKKLVQYAGANESFSDVVKWAYLMSGTNWSESEFKDAKPQEWSEVSATLIRSYRDLENEVLAYQLAAELFPVSAKEAANGRTLSLKAERCQRGIESLAKNPYVQVVAPNVTPETVATSASCGVGPYNIFAGYFAPGEALSKMTNKNVWTDNQSVVLAFNILGMDGLLPTSDPDVAKTASSLKTAWYRIQKEIKEGEQVLADSGLKPHKSLSTACNSFGLPAVPGNWVRGKFPGHGGVDWGANSGIPVPTTISGTVVYAQWNDEGYGNLIIVGRKDGVKTYYGHLSAFSVEYLQHVEVGDIVGEIGSTGNSTGPHLHYEVRVGWTAIDPIGDQALSLACR